MSDAALADRLNAALVGALDLFGVYLGDRLGLYAAMRDRGPVTSAELAAAAGVHERYAREWLEQQAATGILTLRNGRFSLPPEHEEALLDRDSLGYVAPNARFMVGAGEALEQVVTAFRTGGGVPYTAYPELRDALADANRVVYLELLGSEWLPAIPAVDGRLRADRPVRVADVACGAGWSSIAIARAYPSARVDGIDLDDASIALARQSLAACPDVAARVAFALADAADPKLAGRYDLVTVFEALHDMTDPIAALRAMRSLAAEDGVVLVADEITAEDFSPPGDERERMHYGFSVLHCLPVGMNGDGAAGTGTCMRPSTLRAYARAAGFAAAETVDLETDYFRFYLLTP